MENLIAQTYNVTLLEPDTRKTILQTRVAAKSPVIAAHASMRMAYKKQKTKKYAVAAVSAEQAAHAPIYYLMSITPESGETAGKLIV